MNDKERKHLKQKEWKRDLNMYFRPFGVIRLCLIMIGAALLLFIFVAVINNLLGKGTGSILYQVSFALSTGAVASGIVSIVVEMSNNYEKNRKRLRQLSDYFSAVASYEMHKRAVMHTYGKEVEEDGESSVVLAWQKALQRLDDKIKGYAEDGEDMKETGLTALEIAGIANQVTEIGAVFKKIRDADADMLTTEEYEEVSIVLSTIKMMRDSISIALMMDDSQDISEYKKSLFLKRAAEKAEKIAFKSREQLIRIANKGLKQVSHMLNKKDYLYHLDEEYIQQGMYQGIPELKNGMMEHIKAFEKDNRQYAPYEEMAQRNLGNLLSMPFYIDLETRIQICMCLKDFDESMKLLKEYVKKEPMYGYEAEYFEKEHV